MAFDLRPALFLAFLAPRRSRRPQPLGVLERTGACAAKHLHQHHVGMMDSSMEAGQQCAQNLLLCSRRGRARALRLLG